MFCLGNKNVGEILRKEFLMGCDAGFENVAFCNHGSYGATPKKVMDERYTKNSTVLGLDYK